MTPEEKLNAIKFGLADIIGIEKLESKVLNGETLKVYWGTCPTGPVHLGYLVPLIKIAHLVLAGCDVTILLADLHAQLDSVKTSWEILELRTRYYELAIKQILTRLLVDIDKIKFIKGSEFQFTTKYTIDVYKLMSRITVEETQESVKNIFSPTSNQVLSGLVYPILQILDEIYLDVDCELGGLDQQNIFAMGQKNLSKMGYEPNIYLMNHIVPNLLAKSLSGSKEQFMNFDFYDKMSSSGNINTIIDINEDPANIYKKINLIGQENKFILFSYLRHIIFPVIDLQNAYKYYQLKNSNKYISENYNKIRFNVVIDGLYGDFMGIESFENIEELELAYKSDLINLHDVKQAVSKWIGTFFCPIKKYFNSGEMIELLSKCFE